MANEIPLGRKVAYPGQYSPTLLFAVSRREQREALGIGLELPFRGVDIWNAWELSWLDPDGKPCCATAEIRVPADSTSIIESKSLKLYLNSLAMTAFATSADVRETMEQDLSDRAGADVAVTLAEPTGTSDTGIAALPGHCLDDARIRCSYDRASPRPELLVADPGDVVAEELHTHLLRSLCPVTSQPDTGSVLVSYSGPRIARDALLQYIVSYRQHEDFHEACVERMFVDIVEHCRPTKLSVYARYNRRGGIDINPFRSNDESEATNIRLWRQ